MHAEDKARYEKELQQNPEAQRRLEKAKKRAAVAKAGKTKIMASITSIILCTAELCYSVLKAESDAQKTYSAGIVVINVPAPVQCLLTHANARLSVSCHSCACRPVGKSAAELISYRSAVTTPHGVENGKKSRYLSVGEARKEASGRQGA